MKRLKFYGLGGQGVVTAAKVLSTAVSIHEDEYAITIPAYGHERRGAPVNTSIMIDSEPIKVNCYVYEPDIVLVFDSSVVDKGVNIGEGIHSDSVLVLNTGDAETARAFQEKYGFGQVWYADGTRVAMDTIGRSIPNGSMLGAFAHCGACSIESIEAALKEFFGAKAGDKNAKAARTAYEQTHKL